MTDTRTHHIDIDEREARVTCPECHHEHRWEWNGSNGMEASFTQPCDGCGVELTLYMQIGAVLTSGDFEEEGWM